MTSRSLRLAASAVFLAAALPVSPAAAATTEVEVRDVPSPGSFSPGDVSMSVADSVHWARLLPVGNNHNVSENGRLFRSGAPTTGAIDFTAKFSAGTFNYRCEIHGSSGMVGIVRVRGSVVEAPAGLPFGVRWATASTTTGNRWDVQYRVGTAKTWRSWKVDSVSKAATFGKLGRPVELKSGRRYQFRMRSQKGSAQSKWSPLVSFRP